MSASTHTTESKRSGTSTNNFLPLLPLQDPGAPAGSTDPPSELAATRELLAAVRDLLVTLQTEIAELKAQVLEQRQPEARCVGCELNIHIETSMNHGSSAEAHVDCPLKEAGLSLHCDCNTFPYAEAHVDCPLKEAGLSLHCDCDTFPHGVNRGSGEDESLL